ncbi:hypothetical protein Tco_0249898, partial [Tanacetum coccineum]
MITPNTKLYAVGFLLYTKENPSRLYKTYLTIILPVLSLLQSISQYPVISNDVEEDNHDIEVAHMDNDPYFGVPEVIAPVVEVIAPVPAVSTGSPSSTNIDQD